MPGLLLSARLPRATGAGNDNCRTFTGAGARERAVVAVLMAQVGRVSRTDALAETVARNGEARPRSSDGPRRNANSLGEATGAGAVT